MSTIQLTNNTTLDVTASSADIGATLNRYLKQPLTFITPAGWSAIAATRVGDVPAESFPFTASAQASGKFDVEDSSLCLSAGASATIDRLTGDSATAFLKALNLPADVPATDLVSFGLEGTFSAGLSAKTGDFSFGVTEGATVTVTSFFPAAKTETFADAVKRAVTSLTIPHDLADLRSLSPGSICQLEALSCLKFSASVTYNIFNNPLATAGISQLPPIVVNATVAATLAATATHTSDHIITIARLAGGRLHLSVTLKRTDDFQASLTASAGVAAGIGDQDAIAFLLDKISLDSKAETAKLKAGLPPDQAEKLAADIKAAIDDSLSSSLQASLKAAFEEKKCNNRIFLYEIDLDALDNTGTAAVQSALTGDFTAITTPGAKLAGIAELDSALTVTTTVKHCLTIHLLGIYNFGSTHTFIEKSSVDFTKDTHEIVLSDRRLTVAGNNLDSVKLREVVVKGVTLTLPAAANTKSPDAAMSLVFFDRQAGASPSLLHQFVNVMRVTGSAEAAGAINLLAKKLNNYGTASLFLSLTLTPSQCRRLFIDAASQPRDWTSYAAHACDAQQAILTGDSNPISADRLKLYNAGPDFWIELNKQGAAPNINRLLASRGIGQEAQVDAVTVLWWSLAMQKYAQALASNQSLIDAGKDVVVDANRGFNEPWLILAIWNILENPALQTVFTCSPPPVAIGAGGS